MVSSPKQQSTTKAPKHQCCDGEVFAYVGLFQNLKDLKKKDLKP